MLSLILAVLVTYHNHVPYIRTPISFTAFRKLIHNNFNSYSPQSQWRCWDSSVSPHLGSPAVRNLQYDHGKHVLLIFRLGRHEASKMLSAKKSHARYEHRYLINAKQSDVEWSSITFTGIFLCQIRHKHMKLFADPISFILWIFSRFLLYLGTTLTNTLQVLLPSLSILRWG